MINVSVSSTQPEITSPAPNKKKRDEKDEGDKMDLISNILDEILGRCTLNSGSEVELNYQCGVCGKLFETEHDSQKHIDIEHDDPGCQSCALYEDENKLQCQNIQEKDKMIKQLVEKGEYLVKKNMALDKENQRLKLAFKESMIEKEDIRKELKSQNGAIDDILKQNVSLNDEIKVKTDIIKLLTEQEKAEERHEEPAEKAKDEVIPRQTDKEEEVVEEVQEVEDDRIKYKECDFKTRVRTYMKSHKMAHEGQWKCQRGCKEAFKTWTILDEHHKSKHSVPKAPEFKCAQCDLIFTSKQHLRQHVVTKHERSNNSNMPIRVSCEYCGLITNSHQEMINHKRDCNSEFSRVSNKVCKYFLNGGCLKGESCIFKHPQENQERAPPCRNGFQC